MEPLDEAMLLLPISTNSNSPSSFFQKLKRNPVQAIKKIGLTSVSAFSGYMYWPSSFSAASSIGSSLRYPAALGGSVTNSIFNFESFLSLTDLPKFRSMPWKYMIATLFSIACVAPNFFMNIYDNEKQAYVDNPQMILQASTAFLNIFVNVVGTLELIENASSLLKNNNLDTKKEELTARINQVIESFSQLPAEKQTAVHLNHMLNPPKLTYYFLNTGIGVLSLPQFVAYTLISYFGMKNLAENAWNIDKTTSIVLGAIAAVGNGIPGAGFSIKGLNFTSKKVMSLEKPSLLAVLFVLPALFSGFTTHKAMADSLKEMGYSGPIAETLNWISNLGSVFFFNFPQMSALADRLIKNSPANESIPNFKERLQAEIQGLNSSEEIKKYQQNGNIYALFKTTENINSFAIQHPHVAINSV
jgi:hypothetical protein